MANAQDILRKLNKDRREEDKIKKVSDYDDSYFIRSMTSTGSPYLDYVANGGWADGGFNLIIADGGVGKSSIALLAAKDKILKSGKMAVYYDGEGTLNDSYIERMGVPKDKMIYIKDRNLEDMLDTIEAFSTADDVGIIIVDSIPIFVSSTVEAKSAGENNMAVEARKFSARFPIIEGNCLRRSTTLIALTSYKLDPGAMGDPRKLPRGLWQYTMGNTIIELTKKEQIFDVDKTPIGHKLDVRVKKSKTGPYDAKTVFKVNFYYEGGFKEVDENAQLFVELGFASSGGAWITFPDQDSLEIKVNGMQKFVDYLKENPKTYKYLLNILNNG
jgi:RecA/RadA recombinase